MAEGFPTTVHGAFLRAAEQWPDRPFMAVLDETARAYGIAPGELTYTQAAAHVACLAAFYRRGGYGAGHRVGLLLENRPSFLLHWLALASLGACMVPVNPDLRSAELEYLIAHSDLCLLVAINSRHQALRDAALAAGRRVAVVGPDQPPPPAPPGIALHPGECALLYTSGTTGLPKGCILTHDYFLEAGRWYSGVGGHCAMAEGVERMLTPLPLFHMNALAYSTMAMVLTGGCLIVLDRFHPRTWWASVAQSDATIVHYLGVMPAMLMAAPPSEAERGHAVRFGFGAGVDRALHAAAEARFGFPLIEAWAMTETGAGAVIAATAEPRDVGSSSLGRPGPEFEVSLRADDGSEAAQGELLVRRTGPDSRFGFFAAYLKDQAATEAAWEGGWFHTGDIVARAENGSLRFIDRKKNVIRRSGENISALEVEGVLQLHPLVRAAAVTAVPDAIRGDEVLACIVAHEPVTAPQDKAAELVAWCLERLAYYKSPGYVAFMDALPLTATNKIQRGAMRDIAARVLTEPGCIDTRAMKQRQT